MNSKWLELLARLGFAAKGFLYGVVGLLAFLAAIGEGGRITDTNGALRAIVSQPFGHTMLLILAIGLFGYAAWRTLEGIVDSEGRGDALKDLAVRASYVVRGLLHGYFGWKVLQLYRGFSSPRNSREELVAETFRWPLGEWAVAVCRAGIAARGLVFGVVAWYLIRAGITGRASQTADSADAIRIAASWPEPLGSWLLAGVGAGLLAYGGLQALNAKYRTIRT